MKRAKQPVRALMGDEIRQRAARGRARADVRFPVPPPRGVLPADYAETLAAIRSRIREGRTRVASVANASLIQLYWDLGRMILQRQESQGWGARVIERLAEDLRAGEPGMKGLSVRNLLFMRSFAAACPDAKEVKQLVSRLPWGHVIRLLQRVKEPGLREWYMRECIRHGWSRSTLELQIDGRAHHRRGKALTNFRETLPTADSDMASEVFKDPYLFDFLGMADMRREREVEQALVDHIQRFLLELGSGFAFVGRQVHLEFASRDFHLDLLFYHLKLRRYVVVELKAVPFEPAFIGQINVYLSAVDDLLRHPDDKPTIGLLLCRSKEKIVVEYALRDLKKPIGVAEWETTILERLPVNLAGSLPSVTEIEAELRRRRRGAARACASGGGSRLPSTSLVVTNPAGGVRARSRGVLETRAPSAAASAAPADSVVCPRGSAAAAASCRSASRPAIGTRPGSCARSRSARDRAGSARSSPRGLARPR